MQAEEIFLAALEKPTPAERKAYLEGACGNDAALRAHVEALLHSHREAGSFLEAPLFESSATIDQPAAERPGTQIGPYKLLQQIGEGGFGVVFMAEQAEPVRRRVAVKVIKPGMDTRQVIARFEAERQALAVMDHPSIAKVLDAGTTESGRPYFVMELVRGVPITHYCDENNLPVTERLELFAAVCRAIQHAHTKGIIHRDIKPTNVLVTRQDGQPVVKVIDFGIAKALGQQLTDKTLFTEFAQMIGTPLYMSPEQAELSATDIDTRSDIYSLGVLLYELLTGSTPVSKEQLQQAAFDEIRRIIREEEPPKPSARISTAATAPSIAAHRHTEPARLAKLVRGELDWIVMKALEKDRSRRYETANGFAADVLHYLHDEPVLACPPSVGYRLRKFARRNKAALATATVVVATLVLGTAVSISQAIRATKATAKEASARREAEANLGKARQAVQQMLTRVAEERLAYIPQAEEVRRKLLEDALRFYEELLQQQDVDPAIQLEAAMARLRVGNMARVLGRHREAEEHCRAAVAIMQRLCREQPDSEQFQIALSDAYQGLGEALGNVYKTTEAVQALEHAIRLRSALAARSPQDPNHRQRQSVSYRWLALALAREPARRQNAADACRQAIEISRLLVAEFPSSPDYLAGLASGHYTLCTVLDKLQQPEAAREHVQAAVTLFERLESASSDTPASLRRELGTTHQGLAAYRHDFASAYCRLGDGLAKDGDRQEAAAAFRKGLAIYERLVADFPSVPLYRRNLAANLNKWAPFLEASGDKGAAEDAMRRTIDLYREQIALAEKPDAESSGASLGLAAYRHDLAAACWRLGDWLAKDGNRQEAAAAFREGLATYEGLVADFPSVPLYRKSLASKLPQWSAFLEASGDKVAAEAATRRAIDLYREQIALAEKSAAQSGGAPAELRAWGDQLDSLGRMLLAQFRMTEAADVFRQNVDVLKRLVATRGGNPDDRLWLEVAYTALGFALKLGGRNDEAIIAHHQALALAEKLAAEFPQERKYLDRPAVNHWRLGDLLRTTGRLDQALEHYQQALEVHQAHAVRSGSHDAQGGGDQPARNSAPIAIVRSGYLDAQGGALLGLTQIYSLRGQNEKAAETYEQFLKIKPVTAYDNYYLAFLLATCEEPKFRDPVRAVEFAKKAVEQQPLDRGYLIVLGVAQYRAGDWQAASAALKKSAALGQGGDAYAWFLLAMAHWRLGQKEEARQWYDQAVEWMEKNAPGNTDLRRFRAEAEELLKQAAD